MNCLMIIATAYLLGVSPSDGTAMCFGTEESGAFVPAIFEERRHIPGMTDTLKGVRFLIFDSHVTKIDAHAFEGAMDLETIAFEGTVPLWTWWRLTLPPTIRLTMSALSGKKQFILRVL